MNARMVVLAAMLIAGTAAADEIYVSPNGNDAGPGTRSRPLRTFQAAQQAARKLTPRAPVTVWFRGGTYYLPDTVVFTEQDSGTVGAPVVYSGVPGEEAVISGGSPLQLAWTPYRDGIMQARVPAGLDTDQLFVNGQRQHMARYPNVSVPPSISTRTTISRCIALRTSSSGPTLRSPARRSTSGAGM